MVTSRKKRSGLILGPRPLRPDAYDETGQITSITDPNPESNDLLIRGQLPEYEYRRLYNHGGIPSQWNDHERSILQRSLDLRQNGVAHITKFAYGYNDGELTQTTDENSQSATYRYNDSFGRLTESDYPDGGQTTRSFNDSVPSVTTAKLIYSGSTECTTVTFDGVNHPIQSQLS